MKIVATYFAFLLFFSKSLFAGGFQVNLQSVRQTGMAHTGVGLLHDNSLIFFNPGGLSLLDSVQGFNVGGSFIFPKVKFTNPGGDYSTNVIQHIGTPFHVYANFRFKKFEVLHFGIGIYTPFGSRIQWNDEWKGKFLIQEINLKTIFIQPTLSYRITPKLGIGIGFVIATGNFSLRKAIPLQNKDGEYGSANLIGDAKGKGLNAGIFYKLNNYFTFGFNYRSSVKVSVNAGTAIFSVPTSVAEYFPNSTFTTELSLPSVSTLGLGFKVNDKIQIALDINYIGWSVYDSLIIDFEKNTTKLADVRSPKKYKNSMIIRAGTDFVISKIVQLRAGAYYDFSPVKDGYLSPETPDTDKLGLSAGTSIQPFKWLYIDGALLFTKGRTRKDINIETQFEANYQTTAWIPSVGLRVNF